MAHSSKTVRVFSVYDYKKTEEKKTPSPCWKRKPPVRMVVGGQNVYAAEGGKNLGRRRYLANQANNSHSYY